MKMLKSLVVSLVVLFSLFSLSVKSQVLTFDTTVTDETYADLDDYVELQTSDIVANDTLFNMVVYYGPTTYKYCGIINSVDSNNVVLKFYMESNYPGGLKNYITLTGYDPNVDGPYFISDNSNGFRDSTWTDANGVDWNIYSKTMTYSTNTLIDFNTLTIKSTDLKFSFKFNTPIPDGFNDFFATNKPEFKVYPNPCENTLNIEADGLKRLFDTSGRLLMETKSNKIDMSSFEVGMYFVELDGVRVKVMKK